MRKEGEEMKMILPYQVEWLMKQVEMHGYECFLVGGCVRDHLLGRPIHDYDLCTNATPKQMTVCLGDTSCKLIMSGVKHGTITVLYEGMTMEITTYRQEGGYERHRRPRQVSYCDDLISDLSRRDFTINAMAYHPSIGLLDPFQGQSDLKHKIIRCVGECAQRFEEDALRILRALRFSFQFDFALDPACEQAIKEKAPLLSFLSKERIKAEWDAMLNSDAPNILRRLKDAQVLPYILPELTSIYDVPQESKWHIYDVFTHSDIALNHTAGLSLEEKLAVVLHDVGKAQCKSYDARGNAHFYAHPEVSAQLAQEALTRLTYPKRVIRSVTTLIRFHDYDVQPNPKAMRRFLAHVDMDMELAQAILRVQEADDLAKHPQTAKEKLMRVRACQALLQHMKENETQLRIKDMAVNGHDLIKRGYAGKQIGDALSYLYRLVLDDPTLNDKDTLLHLLDQSESDAKTEAKQALNHPNHHR